MRLPSGLTTLCLLYTSDNFDKHIEDTMIAGDWISNRAAVEKVVREAPAQIEELIKCCLLYTSRCV